ncbi:hypothetical protein [Streptomyces sp. NPDC002187]|uniref:hypothetical protein n=1 Tax=Streptomyces sp. NPDC002187 TaxID=3364637 RepID=UPI0036C794A8
MRTRTIAAAAVAAALLLVGTGCSSYSVEDCQRAINDESTKTNRPKQCEDLSQEDYDLVLAHWAMKKALNDMDKTDRDTLDYYDDGSINGSISGD